MSKLTVEEQQKREAARKYINSLYESISDAVNNHNYRFDAGQVIPLLRELMVPNASLPKLGEDTEELRMEQVKTWELVAEVSKELKKLEMDLRRDLILQAWPEGTSEGSGNKERIGDSDLMLQATVNYTRDIDEPVFAEMQVKLLEQGIPADELVSYKPKLNKSVWNKLTEEQEKQFAPCIIEKPQTPALQVKPYKAKK